MSLGGADQRYFQAAVGYIDLNLPIESNAALDKITPANRSTPEVLKLRAEVYEALGCWELLHKVAQKLTQLEPMDVRWLILLASTTRRLRSVEAAKSILVKAISLHPRDPAIEYNLGCYEAELGNISQAEKHLTRAICIDPRFKLISIHEPALRPLFGK
jgi:Flp pilus assembly protein TadD